MDIRVEGTLQGVFSRQPLAKGGPYAVDFSRFFLLLIPCRLIF